jgi:hypothetical protein
MHHVDPQTGKDSDKGKSLFKIFKVCRKRHSVGIKCNGEFTVLFGFKHLFGGGAALKYFRIGIAKICVMAQALDQFRNGVVFNSGVDADAVDSGSLNNVLKIIIVGAVFDEVQVNVLFIAVTQFHIVESLIKPLIIKIDPDMGGREKSVGFRHKGVGVKFKAVFKLLFARFEDIQRCLVTAFNILPHIIIIIVSHGGFLSIFGYADLQYTRKGFFSRVYCFSLLQKEILNVKNIAAGDAFSLE